MQISRDEKLYNEVLESSPELDVLIDYIKNTEELYSYEIDDLLNKIKEDKYHQYSWEEKNIVTEQYLPELLKKAYHYSQRNGANLEEAFQNACVAFCESLDNYDPESGKSIIEFASPFITEEMNKGAINEKYSFSLSVRVGKKLNAISSKIQLNDYSEKDINTDYSDLVSEVTEKCQLSEKEAVRYLNLAIPPLSYEENMLTDPDKFPEDSVNVERTVEHNILEVVIDELLDTLTPREREVLELRHGFKDGKTRTLEEVGRLFYIERERIRQIEEKAYRKLIHPTRIKMYADYWNDGDISKSNKYLKRTISIHEDEIARRVKAIEQEEHHRKLLAEKELARQTREKEKIIRENKRLDSIREEEQRLTDAGFINSIEESDRINNDLNKKNRIIKDKKTETFEKYIKHKTISIQSDGNNWFLKKQFNNKERKIKKDVITIAYRILEGFQSVEESKEKVSSIGYDPEVFVYIEILNMWYAGSLENLEKQLCISQNKIKYRYFDEKDIVGITDYKRVPTIIQNPKIGSLWSTATARDLSLINGKPIETVTGKKIKNNKTEMIIDTVELLGGMMFNTFIPAYQMEIIEDCYMNIRHRNIREYGLIAYNSFSGEGIDYKDLSIKKVPSLKEIDY